MKTGIHWSPQEFIEKALEVGRPILVEDIFPVDVRRAIWCCVGRDEAQTAVHRTEVIKKWISLIGELEHKEVELKSSLPTRIAEVLKAKRLVLFKTLLEEANHPDDLVADLCKGFDLTGRLPESGVFKQKFRGR
ncbi:Uncharacterized protein SCF082_LOCUS14928 [Durusdinium trenchii]|uniref:Uncharacterized protein n=1 Tax=Durusdinium trenchii TaxID=1381693 RepID=A0ABP0K153_9DINO